MSLWGDLTGAAKGVYNAASGVVGYADKAANYVGDETANVFGANTKPDNIDWNWDSAVHTGNLVDNAGNVLGGVAQGLNWASQGSMNPLHYALGAVNKGFTLASNGLTDLELAGAEANANGGAGLQGIEDLFKGRTWTDADRLRQQYGLNPGSGLAVMLQDKHGEVLNDAQRIQSIKNDNGVVGFGELAFNIFMSKRIDPLTNVGRAAGGLNQVRVGQLSTDAGTRAQEIAAGSADSADAAKAIGGAHGQDIYQRGVNIRYAARTSDFNEFQKQFVGYPSGGKMASVLYRAAQDDDHWNTVWRAVLGDGTAVNELAAKDKFYQDQIEQIEQSNLIPQLEDQLQTVTDRYNKAVATATAQGKHPEDAFSDGLFELASPEDPLLKAEKDELASRVEAYKTQLQQYKSYQDFARDVLPSLKPAGGGAVNSVFGGMDRLGSQRSWDKVVSNSAKATSTTDSFEPPLITEIGDRRTFRDNTYGLVHHVWNFGQKQLLFRTGMVDLNDVDAGMRTLNHNMDQVDHILGSDNSQARSRVLQDFASAAGPQQRRNIVQSYWTEATTAILQKHGVSPEAADFVSQSLAKRRNQTWNNMYSGGNLYSPILPSAWAEFVDENGELNSVMGPADTTQIANFHPLPNMIDFDRTLKDNSEYLKAFDEGKNLDPNRFTLGRDVRYYSNLVGDTFNKYWRPAMLLSLRWPLKVVLGDEALRVFALNGLRQYMGMGAKGSFNWLTNRYTDYNHYFRGKMYPSGLNVEDDLRGGLGHGDAYDDRVDGNPTGAVPLDAVMGEQNLHMTARHDAIGRLVSTRRTAEGAQWADEMNASITRSNGEPLIIDPMSETSNLLDLIATHAVSPYPQRMMTYPFQPSARDVNDFVDANKDLLSNKSNKVVVWKDQETGRWTTDIMRPFDSEREAAQHMVKWNAPDYRAVEDGFRSTRRVDEEPLPGFHPLEDAVTGTVDEVQGRLAQLRAQAKKKIFPDMPGPEGRAMRQSIRFQPLRVKTADGELRTVEGVHGSDPRSPLIVMASHSSQGAYRALQGGGEWAMLKERGGSMSRQFQIYNPEDKHWADAMADFVNHNARLSPVYSRMLQNWSDDQIVRWLKGDPDGRDVLEQIGKPWSQNADTWVAGQREIFDHAFTTQALKDAAVQNRVSAADVQRLVPDAEDRHTIQGAMLQDNGLVDTMGNHIMDFVDRQMKWLATKPDNFIIRHPFAKMTYDQHVRTALGGMNAADITPEVEAAVKATARAKATKQIQRTLINYGDERQISHMLRYLTPFYVAQTEIMEKWARIIAKKPETLGKLVLAYNQYPAMGGGLYQQVDEQGNPTGPGNYNPRNSIVIPADSLFAKAISKVLPLGDNNLTLQESQIDTLMRGESIYTPHAGSLITIPAAELFFRDHPERATDPKWKPFYQWMTNDYPLSKNKSLLGRLTEELLPPWAQRESLAGFGIGSPNLNDPTFANTVESIYADNVYNWEKSGRLGPEPSPEAALDQAKGIYEIRGMLGFISPLTPGVQSKYAYLHKAYTQYEQLNTQDNPHAGDMAFMRDYASLGDPQGISALLRAQNVTSQGDGMNPTVDAKMNFDRYRSAIGQNPDLIGILTGSTAAGPNGGNFDSSVYDWQFYTSVDPTSTETIRTPRTPEEMRTDLYVRRGWIEYGILKNAETNTLRQLQAQGLPASIGSNANANLHAEIQAQTQNIFNDNPGFEAAFYSKTNDLPNLLANSYKVAFDPKLMSDPNFANRPDLVGWRTYLIGRAQMQQLLEQRYQQDAAAGISGSKGFSFNALDDQATGRNKDLGQLWSTFVQNLIGSNPMFANIYNRYFTRDDLTVWVNDAAMGGASQ